MLKLLRKQGVKKKIFIAMALVIIPPFVIWGLTTNHESRTSPTEGLGKIDGRTISVKEFLAAYRAIQHQVALMYGDQAKNMGSMINYKAETWDRLLFLHHAKKEGLTVKDAEVVEWLLSQPLFQGKAGFDPRFYKEYISTYLHTDTRQFEEEIRQTLLVRKIHERLREKAAVSDEALKELYTQKNAERDIAYGLLSWESQKAEVSVTDEEAKQLFPIIEGQLKKQDGGDTLGFEDIKEELKQMLTARKGSEAALKKLQELKIRMTSPDSFDKVLTEAGVQVQTIDKLSESSKINGLRASTLLQAAETLKAGEISEPLAVPAGAVILQVRNVRPGDISKFDQDKEKFRESIVDEKADRAMRELLDSLHKKLTVNLEVMRKIFSE